MKLLIAILLIRLPFGEGFTPTVSAHRRYQQDSSLVVLSEKTKAKLDSIANELQELNGGQQTSSRRSTHHKTTSNSTISQPKWNDHPKGFNEYHENPIHKLRKSLREKDALLEQLLQELEQSYANTETAFEIAQVVEKKYEIEHEALIEEQESVRRLLWQAVKLSGRRIKNGLKRSNPIRLFRRRRGGGGVDGRNKREEEEEKKDK